MQLLLISQQSQLLASCYFFLLTFSFALTKIISLCYMQKPLVFAARLARAGRERVIDCADCESAEKKGRLAFQSDDF